MVEQLSTLAATPGPVSRETAQTARQLWAELAETCRGHAELRDSYRRGAEAWTKIRDGHAAQKAGRQGAQDPQAPPPEPMHADTAASQTAADLAQSAQQKRRMIAALEQAAIAEDPFRFVEHVRLCERAWAEMGSAGPEEPALGHAYDNAITAYWRVVDARDTARR